MKEAIAYLRVSSKGQEDGYSLDAQEKQALDYAKKNNLDIVRFWRGSESAWGKKERDKFTDLINYAKKRKDIRHIIFDVTDRMTRNDMDKVRIATLVKEYDKIIHFSRSNKIYSQESSTDDEFMLDIEVAAAKKQSGDISKKTKTGMHEKAEQGIFPSHVPVGYKNNPITKGVDIDTFNAPLIRSFFEKLATGDFSLLMLEDIMYAEGLRHPLKNTKLAKATLHRIAHNPMYYGEFVWGKKRYKGTHTPIVSRELWNAANLALKQEHRPHVTKRNFAFKGLLSCGACNCTILAEIAKGKYTYYRCSFSKGQHKHEGYIREEDLAEKFSPIVQSVTIPVDIVDWLKEGVREKTAQDTTLLESKKNNVEVELKRTEGKLSRLYDMRLDGEISGEMFKIKEKELSEIIFNCKMELEREAKDPAQAAKETIQTIELMGNLHNLYQKGDNFEKAHILRTLGKGYLLRGKDIIPIFKEPFNSFYEANKKCLEFANLPSAELESSRHQIWGTYINEVYKHFQYSFIPLNQIGFTDGKLQRI